MLIGFELIARRRARRRPLWRRSPEDQALELRRPFGHGVSGQRGKDSPLPIELGRSAACRMETHPAKRSTC